MDKIIEKFRTPIISFLIGVLISSVAYFFYFQLGQDSVTSEITINRSEDTGAETPIVPICIAGAVKNPGIFEIDASSENWLEVLSNELEIEESYSGNSLAEIITLDSNYFYLPFTDGSLSPQAQEVLGGACININKASQSSLMSLPGIGEAYSVRIIEARPFSSLADIKRVKGIGDKTYEKILNEICL